MRAQPIPKATLIHTIEYHEFTGTDRYKNDTYNEPVTIEFVRVDETTVFSRDGQQNKVLANAVIFIDFKHSTHGNIEFKERSKIIFNGKTMVVQKVLTLPQLFIDETHHWELEVL